MHALEKRLLVLEKDAPKNDDEVLFIHFIALGTEHDNDDHVRGYRAGGKVFTRLDGETLEALQARVEATAVKPPNGIVVATQDSGGS